MDFNVDKMIQDINRNHNIRQEPVENQISEKVNYKLSEHEEDTPLPNKEDYQKILNSYDLIPRDKWSKIEKNTYIRYINKDGELKLGARVSEIINDNGGLSLKLIRKTKRHKIIKWIVKFENIRSIYSYKTDETKKNTTQDLNNVNNNLNNNVNNNLNNNVTITKEEFINIQNKLTNMENMINNLNNKINILENNNNKVNNVINKIIQKIKSLRL